jgi:hypothetical protein
VESAVGLPVQVEFQEIEGECLILELRLGDDNVPSPSPSRLAVAVDKAVPDVEVLSAWTEPTSIWRPPRRSDAIVTVLNDSVPPIAHRAFYDNLATAQWEPSETSWHLAVPSVNTKKPQIIGLSYRRGHSFRFTWRDVAAIRSGLAS